MYISTFMDNNVNGERLLHCDSSQLKKLGIEAKHDRERIRDRAKEMKKISDKEKKRVEKERKISAGSMGAGGGVAGSGSSGGQGGERKSSKGGPLSSILR